MMKNTFSRVIVVCKSKHEPLYEMLEKKLGEDVCFYENGEVPELKEFQPEGDEQTLIIFDDMVLEKKANEKIGEYFSMGRKKGLTSIYISQSYFKTPKFIRQNCCYIILRGIASKKDLRLILAEYGMNIELKELEEVYKHATSEPFSFMMIDLNAPDDKKFRKNFSVINAF
jgi:hypothetical protein